MEIQDLIIKFKEKYDEKNMEESLLVLKNANATQMQCVRVIKNALNLSLNEADQIILNSKTWEKEKKMTIDFRNKVFDLINEKCGDEDNRKP